MQPHKWILQMLCVVKEAWKEVTNVWFHLYDIHSRRGEISWWWSVGQRVRECGVGWEGVPYRVWEISLSWYGWLHGCIHVKNHQAVNLRFMHLTVLFILQLKYLKIQLKWCLAAVRLFALQALIIFSYMKWETQNFPTFNHWILIC